MSDARRASGRTFFLPFFGLFFLAGCDRAPDGDARPEDVATSETGTSEREEPRWPTEGDLAYVSNEDSGDISILSTATNQVIRTVEVGRRPRGIKVSPAGDKLFVALSGSPKCPPTMSDEDCEAQVTDKSHDGIAIVDVRSAQVERVLPGGSDPEQFDLSADGRRLIVSNEDSDQATIVDVVPGLIMFATAPLIGKFSKTRGLKKTAIYAAARWQT